MIRILKWAVLTTLALLAWSTGLLALDGSLHGDSSWPDQPLIDSTRLGLLSFAVFTGMLVATLLPWWFALLSGRFGRAGGPVGNALTPSGAEAA